MTSVALLAVGLVVGGCGSSAKQKTEAFLARQDCLNVARDRAEAATVTAAYNSGELGSAATVRAQIAKLPPLLGVEKTSFLRPDGSVVPWSSMTNAQRRTFTAWEHETPSVANHVQAEVLEASQRAAAKARARCAQTS